LKLAGTGTAVGDEVGEAGMYVIDTSTFAIGEVVRATLVAVLSEAPGVDVSVAVGAPIFVGVGE
jgi:hypothetical protein